MNDFIVRFYKNFVSMQMWIWHHYPATTVVGVGVSIFVLLNFKKIWNGEF